MLSGEDLYAASQSGDVARVTQILSTEARVDVDEYRDGNGWTPLIAASGNGHLKVLQTLLTHGADINAQDISGLTALHCASVNGEPACVSALLAHPGVDLNAQNKDGETALHLAIENGKPECVTALLAHPGVQLNAQDKDGNTALHVACSRDYLPVAELLLHAGADAQITNSLGKTPEDMLLESNKEAFRNLKEAKTGKSTLTASKSSLPKSDSKTAAEVGVKPKSDSKSGAEVGVKPKSDIKSGAEVGVKPKSDSKSQIALGVKPKSDSKSQIEVGVKPKSDSKTAAKVDTVTPKSGKGSAELRYEVNPTNVKTVEHTDLPQDKKTFSEKHKENLMSRGEYFSKNLKFARDVLDKLTARGIFGEDQKKTLLKCSSDAALSRQILDHLVLGRREHFAAFILILLQTNQRILANIIYRTVPTEDHSDLPMPELRSSKLPTYREIPSNEIVFTTPHGADKNKIMQIGVGSFSIIQLGTYTAIDAKVAFKRVKGSEYGGMPEKDRREFMREASTMYQLRHPDIVTIFGTVCDTNHHNYGIVMEYMEVGSLDDLLTQIEIPWPVKIRMLNDVCRGLRFLNTPQRDRQYCVTHCDIKAQNVLINDQFCAKVADFGQSILHNITMRTFTTKSGDGLQGTITHMSPELLNPPDDNYDPTEKSDVWSFGITVFEACAENTRKTEERRTPFQKNMNHRQIFGMIGMRMQSPFTELQMAKIPQDCPAFLIELMKKCCQVDRDERPSFAEASKILDTTYIGQFKKDIHQAMCILHKRYAKNILDLSFTDNEAEELSAETRDQQSQLLLKLQQLLLPAAETTPGSDETSQGVKGFESKLEELQTLLKQELHTVSNKMDRKIIETLTQNIDGLASMAKDQKEKIEASPLNVSLCEQLEERLAQHIAKLGLYDDEYHFENAAIGHNYLTLVENIYPDDVLDHLYGNLVLNADDNERIRAQITLRDKTRLMLIRVDARGEEGVQCLIEALSSTQQANLACLLKEQTGSVSQSVARDVKTKQEKSSLNMNLNELLIQHVTKLIATLGTYDDNHHFENSVIRQNYEALVSNIDPNEILDYLYQEMQLSRNEYEKARAQTTTRDKTRFVLIKLDARGEEGVNALAEALSTTPQKHLTHLLTK